MIWDRLFGSYVAEDPAEPPVYGIVEPLHTYNPLKATFHEWASMLVDAARMKGWRNRLKALFAPPAWAAQWHAARDAAQEQTNATTGIVSSAAGSDTKAGTVRNA